MFAIGFRIVCVSGTILIVGLRRAVVLCRMLAVGARIVAMPFRILIVARRQVPVMSRMLSIGFRIAPLSFRILIVGRISKRSHQPTDILMYVSQDFW